MGINFICIRLSPTDVDLGPYRMSMMKPFCEEKLTGKSRAKTLHHVCLTGS